MKLTVRLLQKVVPHLLACCNRKLESYNWYHHEPNTKLSNLMTVPVKDVKQCV